MAGALAVALLSGSPTDPLRANLEPVANDTAMEVVHQGGEPLATATSHLYLRVNGQDHKISLSDFQDQIGEHWEPGEKLCLSGSTANCSTTFGGQVLTELRLVHGDVQYMAWDGNVTVQGPPLPNLWSTMRDPVPASPTEGDPVSLRATVGNGGYADLPNSQRITVRFLVDGSVHSERTIRGAQLNSGDTNAVSTPPWRATAGTHTITVQVDPEDEVDEVDEGDNDHSRSLHVAPANKRPLAKFTYTCTGARCTFDGSLSRDPDGTIETYAWTLGTEGTRTGETITHTFSDTGSHTVTLTVTDDAGGTDEATRQVSISGVFDPGFAYEDPNCDTLYTEYLDVDKQSEVSDGMHSTSHCLVVPPSSGPISLTGAGSSVDLEAAGVYLGVNVETRGSRGHTTLSATSGDLVIGDGVRMESKGSGGNVDLDAAGNISIGMNGYLDFAGQGADYTLDAGGWAVIGDGTSITASGAGSKIRVRTGENMTIEGVDMADTDEVILVLGDSSDTLRLAGAQLRDSDRTAVVQPCVTVLGTPSVGSWTYDPSC